MWTGNKDMKQLQKHIPRWSCTIEAGDLIYNPHWMWHKIISKFIFFLFDFCFLKVILILSLSIYFSIFLDHGGLSIGIPVRESNHSLSFQNNWYFTSIVYAAKIFDKLGMPLGGYPPMSFATEADNE